MHTEVDNVPHTICRTGFRDVDRGGKKAWADVLNAKVEQVISGTLWIADGIVGVKSPAVWRHFPACLEVIAANRNTKHG